jgi:hypothetical protein
MKPCHALRICSLLSCLVGCGGAANNTIVSKQIDARGGSLTANGITIEIPAGALAQPVTVTGTSSSASAPDAIGPAFLLGPEGQTFAMPVRVTVPFVAAQLAAKGLTTADIEIETAPRDGTQFTSLGGSVVDATHAAATTTHFSIFVAMARSHVSSDGGAVDAAASDGGGCAPLSGSCLSTPCCSGTCDAASHTCTMPTCAGVGSACSSGSACCSGNCSGGVCGSAGCAIGQTNCAGACVNTNGDTHNCGACGRACTTGQMCTLGVCG